MFYHSTIYVARFSLECWVDLTDFLPLNWANYQDPYDLWGTLGKPHQQSRQDVWKSTTMDSGVQSVVIALERQMQVLFADSLASPHTTDMEL